MDTQIIMYAAIVLFAIVVFLLLREFFAWYAKRNEQLKNQEEIIRLLRKLNGEDQREYTKHQSKLTIEDQKSGETKKVSISEWQKLKVKPSSKHLVVVDNESY